ncbi:MAG: tetratricopeptide repeat protein [Planctomycetes bacterium]|nr:tetratricopeptide repeat protein [Planctomycetota bacterium]
MSARWFNPLWRFVRSGWRFQCVVVAVVVVALGLSSLLAVYLWSNYHFREAQSAFDNGQFEAAREHILNCLAVSATNTDAHFLAARIERRSGQFETAENHLKTYKRLRGITDEFQTEWILLRAQSGESPKLEQALWNCVRKNHPQTLEILETLAACFIREGRYHAAITCLDEWIKRAPNCVLAFEWRGLARENRMQRDGAVEDYEKALELDPAQWQVRLQLAKLLMDMARLPQAAIHLATLNKTHAGDPSVQMAWGQCLFQQGESEHARRVFSELHAKQGNQQPMVLYYLGKLEADPTRAATWFRQLLTIQPAHLEARFALHASLLQAGRGPEAAAELRTYQAARAELDQIKTLYEKMEREPNNPDVLSTLSEQLLDKFNSPQAVHLLYRALAFDPNHQRSRELLAKYRQKEESRQQESR